MDAEYSGCTITSLLIQGFLFDPLDYFDGVFEPGVSVGGAQGHDEDVEPVLLVP